MSIRTATTSGFHRAQHVRESVASYYDESVDLYRRFWSRHALHYGLWSPGTHGLAEALRNADRHVASNLGVDSSARVLDAGCGVGGTSIYLARTYRATVTGLTLSKRQRKRACLDALDLPESIRPSFLLLDYAETEMEAARFDSVFGIESYCHAVDKRAAMAEAFRLLRPGGTLLVLDGFRNGHDMSNAAHRHYRRFLDGWSVDELSEIDEFQSLLDGVGFENVRARDLTERIMPTARILKRLARALYLPVGVPARFGLLPTSWYRHGLACLSQHALFGDRSLIYGSVVAVKPTS